jgi:hypothetical protein
MPEQVVLEQPTQLLELLSLAVVAEVVVALWRTQ